MDRAVRVLLDVNIFVGNIIAHDRGHQGTAIQSLIDMISSHRWGLKDRAQLIVSFEMIDTLERVLRRLAYSEERIRAYSGAIIDIMTYGPDGLDPYLVLGGEERFSLTDAEDAGVLSTAFGARADILVTDNLRDFSSKDALVVDTRRVDTLASGQRILQAFRYRIADADLIVAHPFDVMHWLRLGLDLTPATLWQAIQPPG
jgi:predicted nucleic acid-binding protein